MDAAFANPKGDPGQHGIHVAYRAWLLTVLVDLCIGPTLSLVAVHNLEALSMLGTTIEYKAAHKSTNNLAQLCSSGRVIRRPRAADSALPIPVFTSHARMGRTRPCACSTLKITSLRCDVDRSHNRTSRTLRC